MILKLIIFAMIGLLIYKILGGRIPTLSRTKKEKVSNRDDKNQIEEETLVECSECGTYVTYKESITVKGKIYCSVECAKL